MSKTATLPKKLDFSQKEFREMKRTFSVERGGIDKEQRTVALSFASEEPVERWFGNEILDVTSDACDMTRLNNGGAVLVNHDWNDQVGVVVSTSIDPATRKARAVVKFSRSARGDEIFQDICDGIRSLVSVGYTVRNMVLQSQDDQGETYRCVDWQPYEVSIVAVPADTSVGVGRSQPKEAQPAAVAVEQPTSSRKMDTIPAAPAAHAAAAAPAVAQVTDHSAERQRIKDINAAARVLSEKHPKHADSFRQLAAKCSETGDTIDTFNRTVLNDILATERTLAPVAQDQNAARLGLNSKEKKRYSILRAVRLLADGKSLDGFERECSDELSKKLDRAPLGFFMPDDIADHRRSQRTLLAQSPADGGFTVDNEVVASEFLPYLRNTAKVMGLGARVISGLTGNITIPRQLTGATAYWVDENVALTQSSATFGQIVARPRRLGTSVPYSKQFIAQTSLDAETFVVNDSDASMAVELDRVAINGKGGAEPLGILNLASGELSTAVSFGAAATWTKYLTFWQNVATNNALLGNPAYLTTPASAVKAQAIQKFATYGEAIWSTNNTIGMFKADWSNQFPTSGTINQVIFGDWSQVIFLEWAGRDVVIDPYTYKKEGNVEVTISRMVDMVVRRAKSFCISSDSGAQ